MTNGQLFSCRVLSVASSWQCDSRCRHCFIPLDLLCGDQYSEPTVAVVAKNLPSTVKVIAFTGGEPFLHLRRLKKTSRLFYKRGVTCTVVTSGQWAEDRDAVGRVLSELRDCGLRGVAISVDDYHRPRLKYSNLENILVASREFGIAVRINVVGNPSETISALLDRLSNATGNATTVGLFGLERVGRSQRLSRNQIEDNDLNSCPLALGPLVVPNGDLFACCSPRIFEVNNSVLLRGNVMRTPVRELISKAASDFRLAAVAALGPAGVAELVGEKVPRAAESRCKLCIRLMNTPRVIDELDRVLRRDLALRKLIAGSLFAYEEFWRPDLLPEALDL